MTGPRPAQNVYAWPTNDDGRRWMGIIPSLDLKHNHSKPAPHRINQEVKCRIGNALNNDTSLTTKDLQKDWHRDYTWEGVTGCCECRKGLP